MIDEKVRGGFFKFQIISSATLSRKIRHGKMAMTAFLKPAPLKTQLVVDGMLDGKGRKYPPF